MVEPWGVLHTCFSSQNELCSCLHHLSSRNRILCLRGVCNKLKMRDKGLRVQLVEWVPAQHVEFVPLSLCFSTHVQQHFWNSHISVCHLFNLKKRSTGNLMNKNVLKLFSPCTRHPSLCPGPPTCWQKTLTYRSKSMQKWHRRWALEQWLQPMMSLICRSSEG